MNSLKNANQLKRSLRLKDLVIFGLTFMSPVAAMSLFGIITLVSKGHSILSYLIGFVAMLFTAYSFGKMVEAYPVSGSTYTYAKRSLHPKIGFIAGWGILLDYLFLPILAFLIGATFANTLIPSIPIWAWVLIFAIPVIIVNIVGIEVVAKVNFILVTLMILSILAFVISTINYLVTGGFNLLDANALYNPDSFSFSAVIGGAAIVTVAYLGFDAITTLAEETNESGKKIGFSIIIACTIQTIFFLSVTYFGIVVLGDHIEITNPDSAFSEVLSAVSGHFIQTFITLIIIAANVASALASQSAASRLLYGMGRDEAVPRKFFAYLHPKYKTPIYNILLMSGIGIVGAITLSLKVVSDLLAFGGLFGFICVNLSVISHYFFKNKQKNIFSYLLVPVIGIAVCSYLLVGISPIGKIVGGAWLLIGIVFLLLKESIEKKSKLSASNANENLMDLTEEN
ncbi:APC family permease [Priestia aryabhattai]|uniref:APC family permease n=1 Tax=Priestia aryabhattai TaxID=412384 RepID=UPI001CCA818C|nr:amino acid permease [Priestia aryabhattai]MBZ6489481.1 amino acid permease [Priestia aryabhattai]